MKIFFLLFASIIILSCTKEENTEDDKSAVEGTILKSYTQGSDVSPPEHFFENNGTRYEKIVRGNSAIYSEFVYDANNRMLRIIYENSTTFFYYNTENQIVKMEKDNRMHSTSGELNTWLFTYNGNLVIQELVSNENPNYNHRRIRYTFNNDRLLISRQEYRDSPTNNLVFTSLYMTFKYDNNNMTSLKQTQGATHDLPDSPTNNNNTTITFFEYDDKANPLNLIYKNHYINYIFNNQFPFSLQRGIFHDGILGIGKNNLKRTIYPTDPLTGGISIDNDFKNEYIYQTNNLPKRMSRVSISTAKEFSIITFNYKNN